MCVGVTVLCLPPLIGGVSYYTWSCGQAMVSKRVFNASGSDGLPPLSFASAGAGLGSWIAAYGAQQKFVIRHFDEGGVLSYGYKAGPESLGEPLQIKTWGQFYKSTGPPIFARTGAVVLSFFVAGAVQRMVAHRMAEGSHDSAIWWLLGSQEESKHGADSSCCKANSRSSVQ